MTSVLSLAVVGGGPAGLMAADVASEAGCSVDLYDAKGSVGRKFLLAGKGGLNLTHAEDSATFRSRYGVAREWVAGWLDRFDADALRAWARAQGVETFVGTSGRVFPQDLKAAPLLRGWVRRLRERGVRFHVQHRWSGWSDDGALRFDSPQGECRVAAAATVLALGGASWPELGSDGRWVDVLRAVGAEVCPLRPANCGFEVAWSAHFAQRHAGAPLKPVRLSFVDAGGTERSRQGELVITAHGIEGSLAYALGADLRDLIERDGFATIVLDLAPMQTLEGLVRSLGVLRGKRSLSEHLRRTLGVEGVRAGLLREVEPTLANLSPEQIAQRLKQLPLTLRGCRPIAEAISTAGGVARAALDADLMLRARPGVFCAGEMLDWEAPTGGYLLTACLASGRAAAEGALTWLGRK